jgi:hypothetical protein
MPRVNRDLQRRLAARRERERRRPTAERRYRFASPDQSVAPDEEEALLDDGTEQSLPAVEAPRPAPLPTRPSEARPSARGGRPPARTFSEYAAEYRYVIGDLQRVGLVVGSLLVVLIVLYFVLPH